MNSYDRFVIYFVFLAEEAWIRVSGIVRFYVEAVDKR